MLIHPLEGSTIRDLLKQIKLNGGISITKIPLLISVLFYILLAIPSRLMESKLYKKKIASHPLPPQPIFIIGHWRSGTTHLFNILSKDPQFIFFKYYEASNPRNMIIPNMLTKFAILISRVLPVKPRIMDNVVWGVNEPQEDEIALLNVGAPSLAISFFFYKNIDSNLKYLSFINATPAEINSWKDGMITIYKKKAFINPECTILSKNPYNTGKIKYLLELFPEAKFIHIYRNPYRVFLSSLHTLDIIFDNFGLQGKVSDDFVKERVFTYYHVMMEAFFESKALIPEGNFVEIRYEDLESKPLEQIEKIYSTLNINGFEQTKDKFQAYLNNLKNYKKNPYKPLSREMRKEIYHHLAFTIDKWGYSPDE